MLCVVDGPKFIDCAELVVHRRLLDEDVSVECDIQAEPVVSQLTVDWAESATSNVSLSAGQRSGHHFLTLLSTNTSVRSRERLLPSSCYTGKSLVSSLM